MDLAETHEKLLELMKAFDAICSENDIHYTLHGGTLLGAIREHGFIPWDDDIDTAMTREEFQKLQRVLADNQQYYLYGDIKTQFRTVGNDLLWVDIFVCDYIGTGMSRKIKLLSLTALDIMNRNKNSMKLSNLDKYGKSKQIAYKALYAVGRVIPKATKVKIYHDISENRWLGDKTMMIRSNDQYKGRNEDFPSEWMKEYQRTSFAGEQFLTMSAYHEMLVKCYGEDYMTPIRDDRNRQVHDIVRASEDGGINL
jgi:phosphorylcholine metabolism protein LicD